MRLADEGTQARRASESSGTVGEIEWHGGNRQALLRTCATIASTRDGIV